MSSSELTTGSITGMPVPNMHFEVQLPNRRVAVCDPAGYARFEVTLPPEPVPIADIGRRLSLGATGGGAVLSEILIDAITPCASGITYPIVALVELTQPGVTCPDWPARSPAGSAQALPPPADDRDALWRAAIACGHEIKEDSIVLLRNPRKDGNALKQLGDRLGEAFDKLVASRIAGAGRLPG